VTDGEAPPLQERGVVGLHLVETARSQRETEAVSLDLERRCLCPQENDTPRDLVSTGCFSRNRSSTTTVSSFIAALIHSSLSIIVLQRENSEENLLCALQRENGSVVANVLVENEKEEERVEDRFIYMLIINCDEK